MKSFESLGINEIYIDKMKNEYITEPTKIQEEAIPFIMKGRDIIGKAQTGTGKTLAFALPILQLIDEDIATTQALILTPTRELALQITQVFEYLTADSNIGIVPVYGGHDVDKQINRLKTKSQIVVGTPGRILDHLRKGTINFKHLKRIVIDEADQMMAFGFMEDIDILMSKTPQNLQKMIFSATIPDRIRKLGRRIMKNPINIEIDPETVVVKEIRQVIIRTTEDRRFDSLKMAIEEFRPFMSIIFCKSRERANEVYNLMIKKGLDAEILHGEFSQTKRETIMKRFKDLKFPYLVTTDISARGMDIEGVTHVFNYDIPREIEYYIHRIGRTGRAGETGIAISLVSDKEVTQMEKIQKNVGITIQSVYDRSDYERERIDKEKLLEGKIKTKDTEFKRSQKSAKKSLVNSRKSGKVRRKPRKGSKK
ncbi:ATP-dependent RNA helicase DeaD [Acetoanaerobium pronyense]|uniref:ATP-dependent RNA helicase DeaD n=1 Tax=Acetoanaerobium pronyense TaxID=1482736 RepID=A0ABS4KIR0_9FIRM|nr:DEAD/DEAH box helicase [Acetoanaerobium pronyense]MBP2027673.1 ATP-dependent RNA helicase DeaD [Acetoanaerobium pronyense]